MTMVDGIGTYGGGESSAREYAQGLDPERFESIFCVTRWDPQPDYEPALEELAAAGVEFIGMERHSRLDLAAWRRLAAQAREREIDVLHSHKFGSNFWGAVIAPATRAKLFVAHEHTWSFEGKPLRRLADRRLIAARASAFVAVSAEDRRRMIELEKIPAEKVRLIEPGIPALPPVSEPAHVDDLGAGPVIGTVATMRRQKALDVLIRAAAPLRERFPGLRVLILGGDDPSEPDELPELKRLTSELGLDATVRFLGLQTDVESYLPLFDVAVQSSNFEGSPRSVMEYMAVGLPVVATAVGGVPDIIEDGSTGYLVPRGDHEALAAAIERTISDPAAAKLMGEAGRVRQLAEFTTEKTVGRVESLYEELLGRDRG
jgi:glycosyltransferase involved in cell wall biosynthesis